MSLDLSVNAEQYLKGVRLISTNRSGAYPTYIFVTRGIPFTDWLHNAHSVFFEKSYNVHNFPIL